MPTIISSINCLRIKRIGMAGDSVYDLSATLEKNTSLMNEDQAARYFLINRLNAGDALTRDPFEFRRNISPISRYDITNAFNPRHVTLPPRGKKRKEERQERRKE
jgi:hypothetical protein